jgi:hypothetical protein
VDAVIEATPFLVFLAILIPILMALRRREREFSGPPGTVPGHLRLTRWAVEHPYRWATSCAVALFVFGLLIGGRWFGSLIVGLTGFALAAFGPGRWWGSRRLRRYR